MTVTKHKNILRVTKKNYLSDEETEVYDILYVKLLEETLKASRSQQMARRTLLVCTVPSSNTILFNSRVYEYV